MPLLPLKIPLSVFDGVTNQSGVSVSFGAVITHIRDGENGLADKTRILNVLYQTDKAAYDKRKTTLPAVTWSGLFRGRKELITARFNRVKDPVRGEFWQLGQWQEGKWQSLEDPLVKYLAIDAAPDEPFGRSMMGAALIDAISDLSILDEFQRVLAGAGWARSDFEVVMGGTEDSYGLLDFMPPGIRGDQDREDEFYKNFLEGISDVYKNLAPNEGYAHPDFINVNMPTGAQLNQSFFASIEGLIRLLTRRTTNATSSTNLKQGETDGVDYAGKEQNKDYKELIVGEQETGSRLISNLLNWVPRVMGIQAEVEFLFETPETPEEALELAEVEKVKIENAKGLAELQGVEFDTEMTADDFDTEMDDLRSHSQDCPHCQKKRASDERAATITPDGSEYPLPSPTEIVVTLAILDDAIDWFEDHTTGYKGLLSTFSVLKPNALALGYRTALLN